MFSVRPAHCIALALVALQLSCGRSDSKKAAPVAEAPEQKRVRLVVLIVVDQLPTWSFEHDRGLTRGGFARLLREGAYYPNAELPYASTYTAPGHAAIATGAPPSVTGIMANSWFRSDTSEWVSSAEDPSSPVFNVVDGALSSSHGVSASKLLVDGVADVLERQTRGRSKTISVGLKERATVFAIGRYPDLAVFFDPTQPAMTTSRYYTAEVPPWLLAHVRQKPVSRFFDDVWEPLDPILLARATGDGDTRDGEGSAYGLGASFPHAMSTCEDPARAVRATPFGTELVFEVATAAIAGEKLGADDVPDLLSLSISSHDYAGHYWGQESWERLDLFLRLDASLGSFLEHLDEVVGVGRYAVVLTSDHGAMPLVESSRAAGLQAHRLRVSDMKDTANAAATRVLGRGDWVSAISAGTIHLSPALNQESQPRRDRAIDAVVRELRNLEGVGFAKRTDRIAGSCDDLDDPMTALACRALMPGQSGEVFCAPAAYSITTSGHATGTSHGSPNPEDRTVPIIVSSPGIETSHHEGPVSFLRIAPTLASLLGIPAPLAATEAALH